MSIIGEVKLILLLAGWVEIPQSLTSWCEYRLPPHKDNSAVFVSTTIHPGHPSLAFTHRKFNLDCTATELTQEHLEELKIFIQEFTRA